MTPTLTEDDIFTTLRAFLLGVVPDGCEVFQGQNNRVPEPAGPLFIVMTPTNRQRLATNVDTWATTPDPVTKAAAHNSQYDMQLDIHGPGGSDVASVIAATFPDDYGRDALDAGNIAPLFASDGHQSPFINGEGQYENRWVMTLAMQIKPGVLIPTEFAATLAATIEPAYRG